MKTIIGREKEKLFLTKIWNSKEAELLALYGRRRVGKTFIIRNFFQNKGIYFEVTGKKDGSIHEQLANFTRGVSKTFFDGTLLHQPANWKEAFELLIDCIERLPKSKKILLFFDELPWLSTHRSGLIQAFDYYWNHRFSRMSNLKVVLCGSAASWMLEHLIHAKGGLYNRITQTLKLRPFNLHETKLFLEHHNIRLNQYQVLELYLAMGGIPHYLKLVQRGKTAAENLDRICFSEEGLLLHEFPKLFQSLFDASDFHMKMVRHIAKSRFGISREKLIKSLRITSGGTFAKRVSELEAAGFIQCFTPYGNRRKQQYFRIIDEYTLFYLNWIEPLIKKAGVRPTKNYWKLKSQTSSWKSWAGYAFESVCFKHIDQIQTALRLDSTPCVVASWRSPKDFEGDGAQIDLLFERDDDAIDICEIKYAHKIYTFDKETAKSLNHKAECLDRHLGGDRQIFLHMITPHGVRVNTLFKKTIDNQVLLKDLYPC